MIFGLRRSSPPVIRPLRLDKAEACARLHAKGSAHPWSTEEVAQLIAAASTLAAAALDPTNGRLRGFILSRLAADEAEILTIAVEAASRSKGVGRALLGEALRQASNAPAIIAATTGRGQLRSSCARRFLDRRLFSPGRKAPTLGRDPSGAANCPSRLCLKTPLAARAPRRRRTGRRSSSRS